MLTLFRMLMFPVYRPLRNRLPRNRVIKKATKRGKGTDGRDPQPQNKGKPPQKMKMVLASQRMPNLISYRHSWRQLVIVSLLQIVVSLFLAVIGFQSR